MNITQGSNTRGDIENGELVGQNNEKRLLPCNVEDGMQLIRYTICLIEASEIIICFFS